jgi:hypothetical protein
MDREVVEQSDNTATIATMATSERDHSLAAKIDESSGENGQGFCSTTAAKLCGQLAQGSKPLHSFLVSGQYHLFR